MNGECRLGASPPRPSGEEGGKGMAGSQGTRSSLKRNGEIEGAWTTKKSDCHRETQKEKKRSDEERDNRRVQRQEGGRGE